MKADYKNWMPKGMVMGFSGGAIGCLILSVIFGLALSEGLLKTILLVVFIFGTVILTGVSVWMYMLYRAFSYNRKR